MRTTHIVAALIAIILISFVTIGIRYENKQMQECKEAGGVMVKTSIGSECVRLERIPLKGETGATTSQAPR